MGVQISPRTISILKNFSTINQSIIIKANAKKLSTISGVEVIIANAPIEENFPNDVPIYNLNEFLNVLGLFEEPELIFESDYVTITDGKSSCNYYYSEPELIKTPPEIDESKIKFDIQFNLSATDIASMNKAANTLQSPDVFIKRTEEDDISVSLGDYENSTANTFNINVGKCPFKEPFNLHIKREYIKLFPDNYMVNICTNPLISKFVGEGEGVEYYITLQSTSEIG